MRRCILFGVIAVSVAAVVVWAEQAWKSKPPEKWTKKEAGKILRESPWAKSALMPYHPITDQAGMQEIGSTVPIGRTPPLTDIDETRRPNARQDWALIVWWSSSKTIRRAITREAADGQYTPDPADDQPRRMYEITVTSATTTQPLPTWREAELMRSTYLKFGDDGDEIRPERVMVDPYPGSDRAASYTFRFPREDAEGRPLLRSSTKAIHFYCQLGPVAMRAKFEPAKMVAHDGPDI